MAEHQLAARLDQIRAGKEDSDSDKEDEDDDTAAAAGEEGEEGQLAGASSSREEAGGGGGRFRGVSRCKRTSKWKAQISLGGKHKDLGRFDDGEEAYDGEARKHYDEETLPMQSFYGGFNFSEEEEDAAEEEGGSGSGGGRGSRSGAVAVHTNPCCQFLM